MSDLVLEALQLTRELELVPRAQAETKALLEMEAHPGETEVAADPDTVVGLTPGARHEMTVARESARAWSTMSQQWRRSSSRHQRARNRSAHPSSTSAVRKRRRSKPRGAARVLRATVGRAPDAAISERLTRARRRAMRASSRPLGKWTSFDLAVDRGNLSAVARELSGVVADRGAAASQPTHQLLLVPPLQPRCRAVVGRGDSRDERVLEHLGHLADESHFDLLAKRLGHLLEVPLVWRSGAARSGPRTERLRGPFREDPRSGAPRRGG